MKSPLAYFALAAYLCVITAIVSLVGDPDKTTDIPEVPVNPAVDTVKYEYHPMHHSRVKCENGWCWDTVTKTLIGRSNESFALSSPIGSSVTDDKSTNKKHK